MGVNMAELPSVFSNAFKAEVSVNNNHTSLFKAICSKEWDLVLELLETKSDEVEMWSSRTAHDGETVWNRLPIHQACIDRAPLDVVKALLEVYPQSVTATDLNGRLPVHYAVVYGINVEVVGLLINACPGTVNLCDTYGKTPLMCLTSRSPLGSDIDTYNKAMELLATIFDGPAVKTFTGQLNAFDEDISFDQNSTNLFRAIKNKRWENALKMISENPAGTKEWTQHVAYDGDIVWKRLPIHEACINNAPFSVIEALVEAFRESTERPDLNERLPLHHAAVHGATPKVIELLLRSYPASIEMEDSFGKTPVKCLKPPSKSDFSTYCEVMETLSREPSYFRVMTTEIERIDVSPPRVSTPQISEQSSSEDSNQMYTERIRDLEHELEKEREDNMDLRKKLEKNLIQSRVLENMLEQKILENSKLKHSNFNLKKELSKIHMDIMSQGSILEDQKMEDLSTVTSGTSMGTSFDTRSKPIDSIIVKERNLRNLRAEVKEREYVIEKALLRARSPVNFE